MLPIVLVAAMLVGSSAHAQGVEVRLTDAAASHEVAYVGDTLTVEVTAELGDLRVSGVALFLSLPSRGLALLEPNAARPFEPGIFAGGVEFANEPVPPEQAYGAPAGSALLSYAVVLGPGGDRYRSGGGAVATVHLVCTEPVAVAGVRLFSNPIHTSMMVLDDGRTEVPLVASTGLELAVLGPSGKRAGHTWGTVKAGVGR